MRLKYLIASNKGEQDAAASLSSISCRAQGPAGTVWSHRKSEASPSDLGSGALRHLLAPSPAAPQAQLEPVPGQASLLSPSPGHAPLGALVRAQLGGHGLSRVLWSLGLAGKVLQVSPATPSQFGAAVQGHGAVPGRHRQSFTPQRWMRREAALLSCSELRRPSF